MCLLILFFSKVVLDILVDTEVFKSFSDDSILQLGLKITASNGHKLFGYPRHLPNLSSLVSLTIVSYPQILRIVSYPQIVLSANSDGFYLLFNILILFSFSLYY